jgi:hypothetical protein
MGSSLAQLGVTRLWIFLWSPGRFRGLGARRGCRVRVGRRRRRRRWRRGGCLVVRGYVSSGSQISIWEPDCISKFIRLWRVYPPLAGKFGSEVEHREGRCPQRLLPNTRPPSSLRGGSADEAIARCGINRRCFLVQCLILPPPAIASSISDKARSLVRNLPRNDEVRLARGDARPPVHSVIARRLRRRSNRSMRDQPPLFPCSMPDPPAPGDCKKEGQPKSRRGLRPSPCCVLCLACSWQFRFPPTPP